jgi:hypothetical protein
VDKEREALGCKLGAELEDLVERAERASPPRGADDRDDSVHGPLFVDALSFPAVWARYGESALARHSEVIPYWSRGLSGMSKMMANIRFSSCHGVKVLKSLDMLGSSQVTTLKSESIKARGFCERAIACNVAPKLGMLFQGLVEDAFEYFDVLSAGAEEVSRDELVEAGGQRIGERHG